MKKQAPREIKKIPIDTLELHPLTAELELLSGYSRINPGPELTISENPQSVELILELSTFEAVRIYDSQDDPEEFRLGILGPVDLFLAIKRQHPRVKVWVCTHRLDQFSEEDAWAFFNTFSPALTPDRVGQTHQYCAWKAHLDSHNEQPRLRQALIRLGIFSQGGYASITRQSVSSVEKTMKKIKGIL